MNVLVDTHALLWFNEDDPRLSARAKSILEDERSELFLSVASAWEIIVKVQKGKLKVGGPGSEFVRRQRRLLSMRVLPIRLRHVLHLEQLAPLHSDPFDRILVAQSQSEMIPLLTDDELIRKYPVRTVW